MVVFVGVGFLYMSISILDVFLIIRRSRKFCVHCLRMLGLVVDMDVSG
jgi:hypothetical protein